MDINNLKHVVGEISQGKPAIIRFFEGINCESAQRFNEEFLWLQDYVKPSKITILINSEGGSVMYGMGMYSIIQSCPIEVDCVVEGIAASMGSVIWAAGNNSYMHDYSIIMIHNPFYGYDEADENIRNMVSAFRVQLETVYRKRFGLSKERVKDIMNGKEDADGTYLTAKEAVEAGIISAQNVIKTSKQICSKVKNAIEGLTDMGKIREELSKITDEVGENKPIEERNAITNQNELLEQKLMAEKENFSFSAVSAQLGFQEDAPIANVTGRITELLGAEATLRDTQAELGALKIKYQGKETEVTNIQIKLSGVEAELKKYKDAEEAARVEAIEAMVQAAVDGGKIEGTAKENWVKMAQSNFELTKATLDSIPAREKISEKIGGDPENLTKIQDSVKTAEELMAQRVEKVLGGKREFQKF